MGQDNASAPRFASAWRWWLPPAIVALALILFFIDPFIGDWDALEYTLSALRGYPSSMALGRILFIFYNHGLYVAAHALFNTQPQQAYLLFKYVVVAQGPLVVVAGWILARDLSGSIYSATVAALLMAVSPVFVLYSGQVMTDVPALLVLTVSIIIHLRGIRQKRIWMILFGAALLGIGVNLRETVAFYLPWLVLAPLVCGWSWRRAVLPVALSCLVFLGLALCPFAYWFLTDLGYRAAWFGWRESMRIESTLHPASIRNVIPWLAFLFATAPLVALALPFAVVSEWRRQRLSPILLLAFVGLFSDLLLLFNYSTAIGWRYLLTGLPALAPLSAIFLDRALTARFGRRKALGTCITAIMIVAIASGVFLWRFGRLSNQVKTAQKEYVAQLSELPRDAVVLSGSQTVAVIYWRGVGVGEWEVIGTGAGWPSSRLPSVIETYLNQNRRVFLDADPRWWQPCGWHVAEIEELVTMESRFHFRRVAPTVYEVKPLTDLTAMDFPGLKELLPEKRPLEAKKCFN